MSDPQLDAALARARERLAAELAEIARKEAEKGTAVRKVPTSHAGPALSVLASPRLLEWPEDVQAWLRDTTGELGWPVVAAIHNDRQDSR